MTAKNNLPKLLPPDDYRLTEADKVRAAQEEALGMVAPSSPVLDKVAQLIHPKLIGTPLVQDIVQRLFAAAGGQQRSDKSHKAVRMLVGLAAPQVGKSVRIVIVDTRITRDKKYAGRLECFINPEIVWRSRETEEGREGCFSAGPVWGLVRRPVAVKIRAFTPEGKRVERIFEGFTARIVQHEVDHLNGTRFPDRITNDKKRHWVHAEEIPLYPENIHHWPHICTKARWEAFKTKR